MIQEAPMSMRCFPPITNLQRRRISIPTIAQLTQAVTSSMFRPQSSERGTFVENMSRCFKLSLRVHSSPFYSEHKCIVYSLKRTHIT